MHESCGFACFLTTCACSISASASNFLIPMLCVVITGACFVPCSTSAPLLANLVHHLRPAPNLFPSDPKKVLLPGDIPEGSEAALRLVRSKNLDRVLVAPIICLSLSLGTNCRVPHLARTSLSFAMTVVKIVGSDSKLMKVGTRHHTLTLFDGSVEPCPILFFQRNR